MPETITLGGVTVTLYESGLDGATVVQIDCPNDHHLRVYVNDGTVFEALDLEDAETYTYGGDPTDPEYDPAPTILTSKEN